MTNLMDRDPLQRYTGIPIQRFNGVTIHLAQP
jgi:hypothetical protein